MKIERRQLLKAVGQFAILAGLPRFSSGWASAPRNDPFTLGVASGDPLPDGFVIWTRLAPQPFEPGSGMPRRAVRVTWEVAEDERFSRIARSGEAFALHELGHSAHVEVAGLESSRRYWYRFRVGSHMSPAGTARTAPAPGVAIDRLRIAVAGCQNYAGGYFTAYRHLAEETGLDAIFHYGDYIYEGGPHSGCVKIGGELSCTRKHDSDEIYTLDDYRRRYALYKSDPDLQAAHQAAAFLPTYDDHEVDNNWAGQWDQDGTPPETFRLRRFAAMQAWYENMPVRKAQFPANGRMQMFRRLDYGRLLRVHLLDTRQYRTDQRCEPRKRAHCRPPEEQGPEHMLGAGQEHWLKEGLIRDFGWHLLAQQVMVMPFRYPASRRAGPTNVDSWSGYPQARARLVAAIQERKLTNVVVATGDVHKHHVGVIPSRDDDWLSTPVATEYVTTSISSDGDGSEMPTGWEHTLADNPHTKVFRNRRGYQLFDITRDQWRTDLVTIDKVSAPGGRKLVTESFVTQPHRAGVETA